MANTALHITYHGARASQRAMYIVAIRNIRRKLTKPSASAGIFCPTSLWHGTCLANRTSNFFLWELDGPRRGAARGVNRVLLAQRVSSRNSSLTGSVASQQERRLRWPSFTKTISAFGISNRPRKRRSSRMSEVEAYLGGASAVNAPSGSCRPRPSAPAASALSNLARHIQ